MPLLFLDVILNVLLEWLTVLSENIDFYDSVIALLGKILEGLHFPFPPSCPFTSSICNIYIYILKNRN